MGSFEKRGILVIVIIIVMILAVAIHQWGGAPGDLEPLRVKVPPAPAPRDIVLEDLINGPETAGETWADGTPRRYTIRSGDSIWKLVVDRWKLKESFIEEVRKANPGRNTLRLKPGDVLVVPDTANYQRGGSVSSGSGGGAAAPAPSNMARYQIQEGDTLESIARKLLGKKHRWTRIQRANPGLKPERLRPGDYIWVPSG